MIEGLDQSELRRFINDGGYFLDQMWPDADPADYQRAVMECDGNRIIQRWGRQSGKTWILGRKGLKEGATVPGGNVLITAASRRQAIELYRGVQQAVKDSVLTENQWGIVDNKKTEMIFDHGGRIKAIPSGNDGRSIRGFTADTIIVDEAAYVPDVVFTQVLSSMLATKEHGEFILASTPNGKSGFFYEKHHQAQKGSTIDMSTGRRYEGDLWTEFHVTSEEAPRVGNDFIKEQQQQLSKLEYRQEILGEFVETASNFFAGETIENCLHDAGTIKQQTDSCYLAVDPAAHGADRAVYCSIDTTGNVFELDYDESVSLTHVIGQIRKKEKEHDYSMILIEENGLGEGVIDDLRREEDALRHARGLRTTLRKKESIYNNLKKALENEQILLPDEPGLLERELKDLQYELNARGNMKIHAANGRHDDFADALAFAVYCWRRRGGSGGGGSKRMHSL